MMRALIQAIADINDRFVAGLPARNDYEQDMYTELTQVYILVSMMEEAEAKGEEWTLEIPDYVPDAWVREVGGSQ